MTYVQVASCLTSRSGLGHAFARASARVDRKCYGRVGPGICLVFRATVPSAGGPFVYEEVLAHVESPRVEGDVGPGLEDARDVLTHVGSFCALPGGVVLEDHVGGVHGDDRLDVVPVPGVVVAVDRLAQLG